MWVGSATRMSVGPWSAMLWSWRKRDSRMFALRETYVTDTYSCVHLPMYIRVQPAYVHRCHPRPSPQIRINGRHTHGTFAHQLSFALCGTFKLKHSLAVSYCWPRLYLQISSAQQALQSYPFSITTYVTLLDSLASAYSALPTPHSKVRGASCQLAASQYCTWYFPAICPCAMPSGSMTVC
jgi:hypothetical protein